MKLSNLINYEPVKWCIDGKHLVIKGVNANMNVEQFAGDNRVVVIYSCKIHDGATMRPVWLVN